MREMTFDDIVEEVDQMIDDGASFTSKDVTDRLRARDIHASNKEVGQLLRNNWSFLSSGTNYQRTSVEVEPGVTALLYHRSNERLEKAVQKYVEAGKPYSFQNILRDLCLEDAPYSERSRISDWLRRHIPDGYKKLRDGSTNEYVPTSVPSGTLTTVQPDGKTVVQNLSQEDVSKIINELDQTMSEMIKVFNRQMTEVSRLFGCFR